MKVLIIAGPYEADRVRRAVVSAGFEAVAVGPGESFSGWITASRPDVIVLAPQIVNPDPGVALGKVRAGPRGRVPTFLVGDAQDQARLKGLAARFFPRARAGAARRPPPAAEPAGPGRGPPPAPRAARGAPGAGGPLRKPAGGLRRGPRPGEAGRPPPPRGGGAPRAPSRRWPPDGNAAD